MDMATCSRGAGESAIVVRAVVRVLDNIGHLEAEGGRRKIRRSVNTERKKKGRGGRPARFDPGSSARYLSASFFHTACQVSLGLTVVPCLLSSENNLIDPAGRPPNSGPSFNPGH